MPDRYVLDSSIIAAIFFQEEASSRAVKAVQDQDLLTLDLALSEVGNVAWKRITLFGEDEEVIEEAFKKGVKFITTACEVIKTQELIDISFKIAVKEKVSFYDSLFLAAAEKEELPLLTLDKRLKNTSCMVELL